MNAMRCRASVYMVGAIEEALKSEEPAVMARPQVDVVSAEEQIFSGVA
jgi:hypothetical protein